MKEKLLTHEKISLFCMELAVLPQAGITHGMVLVTGTAGSGKLTTTGKQRRQIFVDLPPLHLTQKGPAMAVHAPL